MVLDNSLVELSKFMLTSLDKKIEKTSTSSPLKTANQGRYICIFICIYIYIYIYFYICVRVDVQTLKIMMISQYNQGRYIHVSLYVCMYIYIIIIIIITIIIIIHHHHHDIVTIIIITPFQNIQKSACSNKSA
jgi:hypothetical protein